jgi:hypothetical protein
MRSRSTCVEKVAERSFLGVSENIVSWHIRKVSVFIFSKKNQIIFALFWGAHFVLFLPFLEGLRKAGGCCAPPSSSFLLPPSPRHFPHSLPPPPITRPPNLPLHHTSCSPTPPMVPRSCRQGQPPDVLVLKSLVTALRQLVCVGVVRFCFVSIVYTLIVDNIFSKRKFGKATQICP